MTQHASLNSALSVAGSVMQAIMLLIIVIAVAVVAHDVIVWLRWKYLCLRVLLKSNPPRHVGHRSIGMGQATAG